MSDVRNWVCTTCGFVNCWNYMICASCGRQDSAGQPRTEGECVMIVYDSNGNRDTMELRDCNKSWVRVEK